MVKIAIAIKKGIEEAGHEAFLLQVPDDVLAKMHAPAKSDDAVVTVADLPAYDGIIFGLSGRSFWDATGGHWQSGALIGKPAGGFSSTGSQGGGQETIGFTLIPQLAHHGMVFVPLGYGDKRAFDNTEVHGGSPYGAGKIANGDGSRMPSELELGMAQTQGNSFAVIAAKLASK
ncbi:flavoprotein-like protein [Pavlovales sp. CCMP2436]|nr:flavoprotein-like protein [Pavlovales sp. CCMP2436]